MKIFVTGGAGFIGSHVSELLINEGHFVTIYDDLSKGYQEYVNPKANLIKANLSDFDTLNNSIKGHDAVIHLAAESIIKHSIENPAEHLKKNIGNAINLLEAMRLNKINSIVFSSSAAVYGEIKDSFVVENANKEPLQPYGASKLAIENILSAYYHSFGINSVSLRYFNVYGPRDDQLPVTRAVPNWFKQILSGKKISLFWKGEQIRDYIFVKDLAKAHMLALQNCNGLKNYNVGSGSGQKMNKILQTIFMVTNKKVEIEDLGERPGDPNILVADISKIKIELGWTPETNLENGLKETYDFYLFHPESLKRI